MKKIAFVCTGNTCRSPMAEYIMKDLLSKKGMEGYEIISFGTNAFNGSPISVLANEELKKRGILNINHSARVADKDLITECDLIIAMTYSHLSKLNYPSNATVLDNLTACGDITDPYGGVGADYEQCALQIQRAVELLIDKLPTLFDNSINTSHNN